ncbi:MAG: HAD family phosphatase [Clostridia bacterium]|nr:HAD family phosphatase [Clostridia bacterium]
MIKLIVSDLDGTLLPYGERVLSPELKRLIAEAEAKGIRFAVSTGRTYGELLEIFGADVAGKVLICCDGAHYTLDGKSLYERRIERPELSLFFKQRNSHAAFVLHGAQVNYTVGNLPPEAARFRAQPITREDEIREKIFKVTTYGMELSLPAYCGLRMHWDGGTHDMAQYVNRFANKGVALSDLQTRLMLTKFETVCLGDSGNDVAMMRGATRSFCVGDRSEELARVCTDRVARAEDALRAILA